MKLKLALVALGTAAVALGAALTPFWGQNALPVRAQESSPCTSLNEDGDPLSEREVIPPEMRLCESAVVSTTVRVSCGQIPLHIMLGVDKSGSMIGQPWQDAVAAASALVQALDLDANPLTEIGLVTHGIQADVNVRLTNNGNTVVSRLRGMSPGGEDNLPQAIDVQRTELLGARPRDPEDPMPFDILVILSDGGQTFPPDQAVRSAGRAKASDILVIAVCLENSTSTCSAVRQMASSSRYYFEARGTSGLVRIFEEIADQVRDISLRRLEIDETIPDGLTIVPDSVSPPADVDPTGRTLSWDYRFVPSSGVTYTYAVMADQPATYTLASTVVEFADSQNRQGEVDVPTSVLTVTTACDTEFPTSTPTATPSPTATNTPTVTPTPTTRPGIAYLPILNLGRCLVRDRPLDVVLAVDASTSMAGLTSDGVAKLEAAKAGARQFVGQMLPGEHGAILSFNSVATLHQGLTADQQLLLGAIDGIQMNPYTRLDLAIENARQELVGPNAQPLANLVLVLLTDGRPTQTTPEEVVAAAKAARSQNITIFAIGLGEDVDPDLLKEVAGSSDRYFAAASAADVARIYNQIREKLPCK